MRTLDKATPKGLFVIQNATLPITYAIAIMIHKNLDKFKERDELFRSALKNSGEKNKELLQRLAD